ncbi:hypothetical protein IMZ68_05535 [Candidatus Bathyarchaeota archaeon]|nr:hypothetical protein [Candidatus Bathyarchaeota archaeon]
MRTKTGVIDKTVFVLDQDEAKIPIAILISPQTPITGANRKPILKVS